MCLPQDYYWGCGCAGVSRESGRGATMIIPLSSGGMDHTFVGGGMNEASLGDGNDIFSTKRRH